MTAAGAGNRFLERLKAPRSRPLVVAHRGDSAHAPENTLEAARLARSSGADAWELDVQLTRDGVAVVIHDDSLERTTDVGVRFARNPRAEAGFLVADFDFEEIRSLDAGSWFVEQPGGARSADWFDTRSVLTTRAVDEFTSGRIRVPGLRECLEFTVAEDWLVNVELKSYPRLDPRLLVAVLEAVRATDSEDRVLLSSFDHNDLAAATSLRPSLALGVLAETPLKRPERYVREIVEADAFHPSAGSLGALSRAYRNQPSAETLNVDTLRDLADAGVPVLVYTVNDAEHGGLATHLARAGVTGIFTDNPPGLLRCFESR